MAELDGSPDTGGAAVLSLQTTLSAWFRDCALPRWDRHGVDRRAGGYLEFITVPGAQEISAAPGRPATDMRRGRVVARQIYAFDLGQRLGWKSSMSDPVAHGCEFLFAHLHAGDGHFHTAFDAAARRPLAGFSLYEQAFYLFALARLAGSGRRSGSGSGGGAERFPVAETAARCLERLRGAFGRKSGGFEESNPPTAPLQSNPHMHLLEAALEWIEAAPDGEQRPWIDLARELIGLSLTRFRDSRTGAIIEFFDRQWQPMPAPMGRIVEPGHQFEWAWLLLRWAESPHSTAAAKRACTAAAERLLEIGEGCGVDPVRDVAINELWDDMTAKDCAAKLWPQTERLKAWCAMLERPRTDVDAAPIRRRILAAGRGLMQYLRADAPGLWHETRAADGTFDGGACKASSLYHVAGAIEALRQAAGARLSGAAVELDGGGLDVKRVHGY